MYGSAWSLGLTTSLCGGRMSPSHAALTEHNDANNDNDNTDDDEDDNDEGNSNRVDRNRNKSNSNKDDNSNKEQQSQLHRRERSTEFSHRASVRGSMLTHKRRRLSSPVQRPPGLNAKTRPTARARKRL